jgi:hypothetical protein
MIFFEWSVCVHGKLVVEPEEELLSQDSSPTFHSGNVFSLFLLPLIAVVSECLATKKCLWWNVLHVGLLFGTFRSRFPGIFREISIPVSRGSRLVIPKIEFFLRNSPFFHFSEHF